ncbi:MAG TPA: deoxyribodipyrimidine photo-lyase [Acidimicrobiia bacterium]|nr:deoxyribodipyrimidine photo-lyase [Acidimicrobiia bacterium]
MDESGGDDVHPVFVLDPRLLGPAGGPRTAFLTGCLEALDRSMDGRLTILAGDPADQISRLADKVGAGAVVAAADFGPYGTERDEATGQALQAAGRRFIRCESPYAVMPGTVVNRSGAPYQVYSGFYRAWRAAGWPKPVGAPRLDRLAGPVGRQAALPRPALGEARLPAPGEAAATRRLAAFLRHVDRYADERDRPAIDGTSRLSAALRWGCLHPRQVLDRLGRSQGAETFRREIAWREFYADVLFHRPETARRSFQPAMARLEVDTGRRTAARFDAWVAGRTGYPIVDAGMRQLRAEAWMHNRIRMIVASFLVKDLHLDWTRGARHFMRFLVDGDLASNQHGWQWVAGTGTDPSPFFRIFNPTAQGEKFDPDGDYVRRYVPELAGVPGKSVHRPWDLPGGPPNGYPGPIVDHAAERREALDRYQTLRGAG